MKEDILANWDEDYQELGGETFGAEWLDNPNAVFRLKEFLTRMWGRIADGCNYLEGEEKSSKINLIQQIHKDLVWNSIRVPDGADLSEDATAERLSSILNNLANIQTAKV